MCHIPLPGAPRGAGYGQQSTVCVGIHFLMQLVIIFAISPEVHSSKVFQIAYKADDIKRFRALSLNLMGRLKGPIELKGLKDGTLEISGEVLHN